MANLAQTIAQLQAEGVWVIGASAAGEQEAFASDLTLPLVLVWGCEDAISPT